MKRSVALGTSVFFFVAVLLELVVQVALEVAGVSAVWAQRLGTYLVVIPLALMCGSRAGRLTHGSVLLASSLLTFLVLWVTVYILNAVAEPAGGAFGWQDLLNDTNGRNVVLGSLATLLVPQGWLWLLRRMAANNSSKPTPLRGAA